MFKWFWNILSLGAPDEHRFTGTHLIWTPLYYGQFTLCLRKESPYVFSKFSPLITDTFLILARYTAVFSVVTQRSIP